MPLTPPAQSPVTGSKLALDNAIEELRSGNAAEAEWLLRQRLLQDPRDANALAKLGEVVRDQGRVREALLLFRRALDAAPAAHGIRLARARLLQQQGEYAAALTEVEQLPDTVRTDFNIRAMEAALLGQLGRRDEEVALYERMLRVRADHPAVWMSLGNALNYAGRDREAVRALRRAIKLRPTYGEAWWSFANMKSVRFEQRDLIAMRKALRGKLSETDALHFHFALAKALEDRGEVEPSFRHYELGNALRARDFTPAQMNVSRFVDAAIAVFDRPLFEQHGDSGHDAADPIFIVGLQRSGSTLIEQILASHPDIEGTAELFVMQQLWDELAQAAAKSGRSPFDEIRQLRPKQLAEIGEEYLQRTRPFRHAGKPMFVDKLPANWTNVGLIRLVLPNAKIVDSRRHPMACGFSNFKQHYASGVAFAYSLESIGAFYRDYLRWMTHMDHVQPGAIHRVLNERLIDDPEGEVRRLLDFIGVPFDPACLEFHRNERAVQTPSAGQVRQPINRDGVDSWRRYEPWLGPLKEALGPALDDWER